MNSQLPVQFEDYDLPEDYEVLDESQVPVPEWHLEIIRERLAKYEAEGFVGTPWEEFEKELVEFEKELNEELRKK